MPSTTAAPPARTVRRRSSAASPRAWWRTLRARARRWSWRLRLAATAVAAAAGAVLAVAAETDPLLGAGIGAAAAALAGVALYFPDGLRLTALAVAYVGVTIPVAGTYVLAAVAATGSSQPSVDLLGAAFSLTVAGLIATWAAAKTSRGRTWVTAALTLSSPAHLGYVILLIEPRLGLWAIYLAMAVVVAARSSLPAHVAALLARWMSRGEPQTAAPANVPGAPVLRALPDGWTAVTGAKLSRAGGPVTVVAGAGGVAVVGFASATGPIRETAATGISIPGITIAEVLAPLVAARKKVARWAGLRDTDVAVIIVVTGSNTGTFDRQVGIHRRRDGALPSSYARLVSQDRAVAALTSPQSRPLPAHLLERVVRLTAGAR